MARHDDDTARTSENVPIPTTDAKVPLPHHTESAEEIKLREQRDAAVARGDENEAARLGELYILAVRKRASLGDPTPES